MSDFKWRHFEGEIILWAVRWYCRYGISYQALDKVGNTIDFYLSPTRDAKAAKRFLGKAVKGLKDWEEPEIIHTDKSADLRYRDLRTEGRR
jgi:transposase-like protein